jgi:PTS system fructose-specific IIC component
MYFGVKNIVTPLNKGANSWLEGLGGGSAILLGVVIGLMMAFDMGGPVNKVAYTFGVAGLTAAGTSTTGAGLTHMAAVMAAGMTPPLGLALATVVRKNLFTDAERENGKAAWVLGASFITEGAIPFAAADPARVIPSIMVGSAVTGGLGGIAVFPLVGGVATYVLAIVIGTVITAGAVVVAKGIGAKADA